MSRHVTDLSGVKSWLLVGAVAALASTTGRNATRKE